MSIKTTLNMINQTTMPVPASAASADRRSPSRRILVVDDHPVNLRLIEMILRKARFEYDLARSGQEAIALYCDREYALVLMDLCMPEMDGYATALKLRQLEIEGKVSGDGGRRTPIVAVSACSEEEIINKCHASGMQAFVPKPVTHVALLDVLETWIGP